ncbi:hypothetical protein [Aurantiacibacter sediminis]|uniref:Uncharacterized protein n=1 Tax=Aurantiacibacter sediminis TaxID=2793064 RepID=A0ABS0MZS3_9SPHN|nr:hypothetical protein [Aurantiacibacter sediminis]MBH5321212.1 hypothetical protein [Aurantiacibacter sediminis]
MKRRTVFAAASALGLSLAACGGAADDDTEEMAEEGEYSAEAEHDGVVMSDAEANSIVDEAVEGGEDRAAMDGEATEDGDGM